jgi:hypothetical protein
VRRILALAALLCLQGRLAFGLVTDFTITDATPYIT